jgi:hypothetical protein
MFVNRCDCRGLLINKTIKSHQTEQGSVEHLNLEASQRLWQDFFRMIRYKLRRGFSCSTTARTLVYDASHDKAALQAHVEDA